MSQDKHSCHIFMFPFRWHIQEKLNERLGEQIAFKNIDFPVILDNWDRVTSPQSESEKEALYNERNYFHEFVQNALYDTGKEDNTNIVRHFERRETKHQPVFYHIKTKNKEYTLRVEYINLNLYSTGVGVLSFYTSNDLYDDKDEILSINQFGRRVYPPFYYDKSLHSEIAEKLSFEGLNGLYEEDFQNYTPDDYNRPSNIIRKMIREVATNIEITSIIDDRMYVLSWYKNQPLTYDLCDNAKSAYRQDEYWYKYIFIDGGMLTCQNEEMREKLVNEATYTRWKNYHTLYGVSRYSFVMLTNAGESEQYLYDYFETEYVRMAELVLVQKASVLRFSAEVTNISSMDNERRDKSLADKVRSLYKEYIRFINQIHFREVSAQDQAIELYDMLYKAASLKEHVEKLDNEIGELYNYISLQGDKEVNKIMSLLTWIATFFVPATFVAGIFGMNNNYMGQNEGFFNNVWTQITLILLLTIIFIIGIKYIINKKGGKK